MNKENTPGQINISDEILCSCVAKTVGQFQGVTGFNESAAATAFDIISKDLSVADGVRLYRKEDKTSVDVYILVEYGTQIPKLAWELQKKIQEDIKELTDEVINDINIHIEGVELKEPNYE